LRRRGLWSALALAACVAVFWALLASSDGPPPRKSKDLIRYYYPLYAVTFDRLAQGELPSWDPYQIAGSPWLATLQAGVFYPPHLLYAALPMPVALALNHVLHLLLIALSTAAFARAAGTSRTAAALAGGVLALRGPALEWQLFPSLLEAASWLPLGALGVLRLARGGGARAAALLGFATAMSLLAGYPQGTVLCGYTWGVLLVALLWLGSEPGPRPFRALAGFALAMGVGALAASAQLLPALELAGEATRPTSPLSPGQATGFGGGLRSQAVLLFGGRPGSPGLVALALAPALLAVRGRRALVVFALGLGLLSGAFALAVGTAWTDLYVSIPLLGWFRDPRRLLFVTSFCAAIGAALACDALIRDRARPAAALAFAGGVLVLLVSARYGRPFAWAVPAAFVCVAAAAALPRVPPAALAAALLAVAALDAWTGLPPWGRLPYDGSEESVYRSWTPTLRALAERAGSERVTWLWGAPPNALKRAADYGLRWVEGYEPLNLERQSQYFEFVRRGRLGSERFFWAGGVLLKLSPEAMRQAAQRRPLLDLAAVRWFVCPARAAKRPAVRDFVEHAGLEEREAPEPLVAVFENPHALPRAWVAYRTRPAPPPERLLPLLARLKRDPLAVAFVEGDTGLPPSTARGHPARIVLDGLTAVEVDAELAAPGLVVLADSYARGWSATVDGEPARVLPTNHLFRGVPARAGRHRIRFEYRTPGLRAGALASVAGLAALLALALRGPATPAARGRREPG
jgi:hypothetical protein